ncbi:peptidase M24 family protein [Vagococcus vulneris]|uniref:Peptidase M24 family protein n=2 Tax=Vagococcus vulneris TaxID=1977869 RepID=A0A429ZWJ2_9ENTE|nr:peptidase M24 family protein [Vagococcus vulneris]
MKRVENLRSQMKIDGIEAFLITNPYNLRYLTGFTGTTGLALITLDNAYFITDFRYTEQAVAQCKGYQIEKNIGPILNKAGEIVESAAVKNLAFEESHLTFDKFVVLETLLEQELIPVSGMIEELREVKDADEIAITKQACQIADQAFEHILTYIKPGLTEIEVANELDFFMRSKGASGVSFTTIVASGLRSAMPHGVASDKVIEQGDFITIDFGCYYNGYVSDMTRTISLGEPSEKLKEIYQIVLGAQERVLEAAKPGMTGIELDAVARDYITEHGYGEAFGHSTGHGIGLEIHEGPNVSKVADKAFVPGNIITNEPGIYLPGIGGVRIEDDMLITENGMERLTHSPKELIIL